MNMKETQNNSETGIGNFIRALHFAAFKHTNQRRKNEDRTPFINHPIELVHILSARCGINDEKVLIAALLHDTIEDTDTLQEEIESSFGLEIAGIVLEVTDEKSLSKEERKALQVEKADKLSRAARLVRIADKISNVSDLAVSPPASWSRRRKLDYISWTEAVVEKLKGTNSCLERIYYETVKRTREKIGL